LGRARFLGLAIKQKSLADFSTRLFIVIKDRQRLTLLPIAIGIILVPSALAAPIAIGVCSEWEEVIRTALKQKSLADFSTRLFIVIKDRQRLTLPGVILVPSALAGLTALFGMGRGDPRRYSHLKVFPDRYRDNIVDMVEERVMFQIV
jgi:hypothetical protein